MNHKRKLVLMLFLVSFITTSLTIVISSVHASPGTYYVSTTGDDTTGDGSLGNPWKTIQHAINNVGLGDTINVAAGTYVENIMITQSVNIIGSGAGTTTLQSSTGLILVSISGAGVSAEFTGFTLKHLSSSDWASSYVIKVANGAYANIHDNILDDYKKRGIYVEDTGSTADITDNTVIGGGIPTGQVQNGIVVWNSDGGFANIIDNEVSGMHYTGPDYWTGTGIMALSTYDKTVTISGNYVHDNQLGIGVGGYCWSSYVADVTIRNNRITNNDNGTNVVNDARGVMIECNKISDNAGVGVEITDYSAYGWTDCGIPTNTIIRRNNIFGNGLYGVFVSSVGATVDAENNWWGHPSGPFHATNNPSGVGDEVGDNVDFDPWLRGLSPCVSGVPVGGLWTSTNKFELLAPYIGLASLIALATISVVYARRRKKKQT